MMMNVPFASTVVCCNENLKTYAKPWERQHPLLWYFLCAGVSGGVAGLLTNPLDIVKTRLQTQEIKPTCSRLNDLFDHPEKHEMRGCCTPSTLRDCKFDTKSTRYTDVKSTVQYIIKNEGFSSFSKGSLARLAINVPSTALSWGTYELVKSLLGAKSHKID